MVSVVAAVSNPTCLTGRLPIRLPCDIGTSDDKIKSRVDGSINIFVDSISSLIKLYYVIVRVVERCEQRQTVGISLERIDKVLARQEKPSPL